MCVGMKVLILQHFMQRALYQCCTTCFDWSFRSRMWEHCVRYCRTIFAASTGGAECGTKRKSKGYTLHLSGYYFRISYPILSRVDRDSCYPKQRGRWSWTSLSELDTWRCSMTEWPWTLDEHLVKLQNFFWYSKNEQITNCVVSVFFRWQDPTSGVFETFLTASIENILLRFLCRRAAR